MPQPAAKWTTTGRRNEPCFAIGTQSWWVDASRLPVEHALLRQRAFVAVQ
jgi:hypothetical protein